MQFLLFVCGDPDPDFEGEKPGEIDAWVEEGTSRGIRTQGDALVGPGDARTVRVRGGETDVTPGTAYDTLVGYDLLECRDLEEAVDYASRHPMARAGRIEVRQVMVWDTSSARRALSTGREA